MGERERERESLGLAGGRVSPLRRIVKFLDAFSVSVNCKADCSKKPSIIVNTRGTRSRKDSDVIVSIRRKLFLREKLRILWSFI